MKIYRIYVVYDEDGDGLEEPLIYGFTNDEKLINLFKKQRDMNKFHIRVNNIDKKENLTMLDTYKGYNLTYAGFKHTSDITYVVCTRREEESIVLNGEQMLLDEIEKWLLNPEIFTNKALRKISDISYLVFYKYIVEPVSCMYSGVNTDKLDMAIYDVDELNLFIKKYGWSLST